MLHIHFQGLIACQLIHDYSLSITTQEESQCDAQGIMLHEVLYNYSTVDKDNVDRKDGSDGPGYRI